MYDENSDTSDVNADEIDKILENMEDLDNALLRGTLKRKDSKKESTISVTESKKKVIFKDFNEDDPLADLSSDEDISKDNSKPVIKLQNKKIADLFGIKSEDPPAPNRKTNTAQSNISSVSRNLEAPKTDIVPTEINHEIGFKLNNNSGSEQIASKKTQIPKSIFNDDSNIILNLSDKPKSLSDQDKKSSLMEDLFGGFSSRTPVESKGSIKLSTGSLTSQVKTDSNPNNVNTENSISTKIEPLTQSESVTRVGYSPTTSISAPRESRRGRRPSGIINPLGLLSSSNEHIQKFEREDTDSSPFLISNKKEDTITKNKINDDLPEWLGGSKILREGKTEEIPLSKINENQTNEITASTMSATNKETAHPDRTALNQGNDIRYPQYASMLLGTQFNNQQAALVSMQQQEHSLRTAATLSQQNDNFSHILESQKHRLSEQEKQFNMLITRQIERQALLEAQMKLQQDRINSYLETLMSQPSSTPSAFFGSKDTSEIPKDHVDKQTHSESLVQKLQLEKLYLENTIESLKEKHNKEITILDDSYKKQVHILEETIERLERRMQSNFENLETDFEGKVQTLKEKMLVMEKIHEEEKKELKKEHVSVIQQIYDRHSQNITLLQNEHAEVIQNISKAKAMEQQAVKTFACHKSNIDDMLTKTGSVIDNLQILQKKIEEKNDTFYESREVYFQTQAEHSKLMKEQLEKQNETSENERKHLLLAAQKLETSAIKLEFDMQNKNTQYNEIEDRLKVKEQALIRERELFLEQTKWERTHLEAMKKVWCEEHERRLELLEQERKALIVEKGKLEISNRLKSGTDDVAKAELDAMIKSAQDAAANAFQERRKWQERVDELELQKSVLQEKEDQLVIKAKELENLTQSALAKREEGLRALKGAHKIEEESKERMSQLQMQLEILAQRENRIATEKLSLARERLSLRITQVEKPEKDTNLMKCQEKHVDQPFCVTDSNFIMQNQTHFTDIVDPQLILLKLDLDNKLNASSQYFDYIHTAKPYDLK